MYWVSERSRNGEIVVPKGGRNIIGSDQLKPHNLV